MIKMSYDQRFYWIEPFAFAWARPDELTGGIRLAMSFFVFLMLAIGLCLVDMPRDASDVGLVVLFSGVGSLLLVYPLLSFATRLPNDVLIESDRIVVGKEVIPLLQLTSAVVGTMEVRGRSFPVLTFRVNHGSSRVFGLSRRVDKVKLAAFFERAGVREG